MKLTILQLKSLIEEVVNKKKKKKHPVVADINNTAEQMLDAVESGDLLQDLYDDIWSQVDENEDDPEIGGLMAQIANILRGYDDEVVDALKEIIALTA